jgi:hypothetical protein
MSKGKTIFISFLLVISAMSNFYLLQNNNSKIDSGLIGFVAGFIFCAGIIIFFQTLLKVKKKTA